MPAGRLGGAGAARLAENGAPEPAGCDAKSQLALGAFGLSLLSEARPPGAWQPHAAEGPPLRLRLADREAIGGSWSGAATIGWEGTIDGAKFMVERGVRGDHRFLHGPEPGPPGGSETQIPAHASAVHHLSADGGLLTCAPADASDPAWWRLVLDSVLFTVALLHGYEALHAAAVATPAGSVAITAATGGGKSTLLSELLLAGLPLMADDVLVLKPGKQQAPMSYPAPPLMTVPSERTTALSRLSGGTPELIATVGEEDWLAVPAHPEPTPLRALVVLDRQAGARTDISADQRSLATLMQGFLRFPRTPERERARFELSAQIAEHVPIWRLRADTRTPPAELAELLLGMLR